MRTSFIAVVVFGASVLAIGDPGYVLPDGRIQIFGSDGSDTVLGQLNELFVKTHPGIRFNLSAKGLPAVSLYGLITGKSLFAFLDRDIWPLEERPFRQTYGYDPTDIPVGRVGYVAPGRMSPPGIYANAKNPVRGLTMSQVARTFTTGGKSGDITHWGQLGLTGSWFGRMIHVYGPRDDGSFASAIRHTGMAALPFTSRYEPLSTNDELLRAVADDPYGIALVGVGGTRHFSQTVRMLPLTKRDGAPYYGASYAEVMSGNYPLSPYLHLYVNCAPGKPCEALVKDYARLALSRDGQAIIAQATYVPLSPKELATQLAQLR